MMNKQFLKSMTCNDLCFLKEKHSSFHGEQNKRVTLLSIREMQSKNCAPCY